MCHNFASTIKRRRLTHNEKYGTVTSLRTPILAAGAQLSGCNGTISLGCSGTMLGTHRADIKPLYHNDRAAVRFKGKQNPKLHAGTRGCADIVAATH